MLEPVDGKTDDKSSDCAQGPTCLGNPASMLPFLTAQADSVFSMASESPQSLHSAGSILTPSTHDLSASGTPACPSVSDISGLDLGNGWKVVGLTSLAGLPLQTSTSVQLPQTVAVTSSCTVSGSPDASGLITALSGVPSACKSGRSVNDPPALPSSVNGEWKIVGLTSLNPENSGTMSNSKMTTVPGQAMSLADNVSLAADISFSLKDTKGKQTELSERSGLANSLGGHLNTPSLAHAAAETCEWKIAGVTTLITPGDASVTCGSNKAQTTGTARPVALPTLAPEIVLDNAAEWKVVGMTSLSSPTLNSAPVMASSNISMPLVTASAPPMVKVPICPSTTKDMVWKVVGVVPLQHDNETQTKDTESAAPSTHQNCDISDSSAQVQSDNETLNVEAQDLSNKKSVDKESVQKSLVSPRPNNSKKWATRCLERHEDPSHPLGFLKNCSNRFRNAVLKRNTVSTMLELKRACQDLSQKEKLFSFMEGVNPLSLSKNLMYFALRRLSKSAKSKSVDYADFIEENSDDSQMSSLSHSIREKKNVQNAEGVDQDCVTENKTFCNDSPRLAKERFVNRLTPASSITDDKLALSMAYEVQIKSEENDLMDDMDISFSASTSHPYFSLKTGERNGAPLKKHQMFPDISLKTLHSDGIQSEVSFGGFDSDAVNLTNVDPWGVCTNEDLGNITEMMTDKGRNKLSQSSSRKRKLSTPRKMIQ